MRIKELYKSAVTRLKNKKIPNPEIEADFFLERALQTNKTGLILEGDTSVSPEHVQILEGLLQRRLNLEPVAYILGEQEFWSLSFKVTKDVLIPRPETEILVERVLEITGNRENRIKGPVLDLGTGSGAISIVLALEMSPDIRFYALDCSLAALQVAQENARKHKVAGKISFINSDWLSGIALNNVFDLVVANPPYIKKGMLISRSEQSLDLLQPDVRLHEPHLALNGGEDGLDSIRQIVSQLDKILALGGWFFMEIGIQQADEVLRLFESKNYYDCLMVHPDYSGIQRVFQAHRKRN